MRHSDCWHQIRDRERFSNRGLILCQEILLIKEESKHFISCLTAAGWCFTAPRSQILKAIYFNRLRELGRCKAILPLLRKPLLLGQRKSKTALIVFVNSCGWKGSIQNKIKKIV